MMFLRQPPLLLTEAAGSTAGTIPPPPAPGTAGTNAGASTISLSRAEYDQLVAARAKVSELEPLATKATTLEGRFKTLFAKDVPADARAQAVAASMRDAGYTQAEIDAHLNGDDAPEEEPARGRNGRGEPDEVKSLKTEVQTVGNALRQQVLDSTNEAIADTIGSTLDAAEALQTALTSMAAIDDESKEVATSLIPTIQQEARTATIQLLAKKRNEGARLDKTTVKAVTKEATLATIKKYQLIIGKASRIGKAPQIEEFDMNAAPVPTPKFNPNATRAEVEAQNEQWALDKLLREANALSAGNARI